MQYPTVFADNFGETPIIFRRKDDSMGLNVDISSKKKLSNITVAAIGYQVSQPSYCAQLTVGDTRADEENELDVS